MSGVAHTSIYAFNRIFAKIGDKQEKVYNAIAEMGQATNEEISEYLAWPINRVTGRVTELRKYGLVGADTIKKNKSGFSAKVWSIRHPSDRQLKLLEQDCEA